MATANKERDIFGVSFSVGDYVQVRCLVTAISPTLAIPVGQSEIYGGAGDSVSLTVETPGNVGEKKGVSFVVSPAQCRKAGSLNQA